MMRLAAFSPFPDNPSFARFGGFAGFLSDLPGKPKPINSMAWGYPRKTKTAPDHRQVTEGLTTTRRNRAMSGYPLPPHLRAVRDKLSYAELRQLAQEALDRVTPAVYEQGVLDGKAQLLKSQQDERERRKVRGAGKVWTTAVYFIRSPTAVKIGRSKDTKRRLGVLQTGHPEPLSLAATCEGGRELERQYHDRFKDYRLAGEWFSPHPEILAEIERLSSPKASASGVVG